MKVGPEASGFGDPSASDTLVPFQLLKCQHLGEGPRAASPSQPHSADLYPKGRHFRDSGIFGNSHVLDSSRFPYEAVHNVGHRLAELLLVAVSLAPR